MGVQYLRRHTTFPSGIAAGGGSTGFDSVGQRTILCKRVAATAATIYLPAGTILLATVLLPDDDDPCTTGDWAIARVTGGAQTELSASAAETPKITAYSPMVRLSVDTEYTLTPTNSPDGYTHVGFEVILPRMRK